MPNKDETQTPITEAGEFTYDAYIDHSVGESITLRKWRDDRCIDTRYLQHDVSIDQFKGNILPDEKEALEDGYTINNEHTQGLICDYFIDPSE